jgi:pSer/pThr/pTyr-binding forkhead associated (FHA) protein
LSNMSPNGTYVNGNKTRKHILSHGDRISILEEDFVMFQFHVDKL